MKPRPSPGYSSADRWKIWNRRLHYFLGLYFLFFIWLFSFTGLLLNHFSWRPAGFLSARKESTVERTIQAPADGSPLGQAQDLMRQAGLAGEIDSVTTQLDPARLEFRGTRPGLQFEVKADWQAARATIRRTEINGWDTMRVLHTFTGVRLANPESHRDWILTTVWALAMDAVALGVAVMVAGGVIMWYGLPGKRTFGLIALAAGVLVCGWLVFGLRWINV